MTEYGAKKIDQVLHQQKACLLKVKTGGGKTYMSIHAVGRISKKARLLILTTKKQVDAKEFEKSLKSYNEYYHSNLTAMVTNYDQLTAPKHRYDAYNWINSQPSKSTVIILDEAHKTKNPTSITTKMIIKMSHLPATSRIIMATATPITNSLLDSMTYLILAGYYRNKTQFIRRHVKYTDQYHQPIVRRRDGTIDNNLLRDPQLIIKRLKSITVEIDTEKLLPKRKNYQKEFQFDKATQKEYRQIQKNWREGVYDSMPEALSAQRHFVATHASQRISYLLKIINNPHRPQTPILIFYQYNDELTTLKYAIQTHLPDYDLKEINGQSKDYDPSKPPTNPKTIILAQYQAAGEGINAPGVRSASSLAPPGRQKKYQQARGRNRRALQKGTVYQFRFVVRKTINEHYWIDLIDNKAKFTKKLQAKMLNYND